MCGVTLPQFLYSVRGLERSELGGSHGAFGIDFYDWSTRTIVRRHDALDGVALGSHEIRPIHSAPSLGQSIHLSIQFTANWSPARRSGFHNPVLSEFLNNLYQWICPFHVFFILFFIGVTPVSGLFFDPQQYEKIARLKVRTHEQLPYKRRMRATHLQLFKSAEWNDLL